MKAIKGDDSPKIYTMLPSFRRTGFGRDEIDPDIYIYII